ncbi:bifunctional glyoxylate/hydroxypyruvate reductase B [Acinetobacter wanghuae]|uniref:Bifunctional glyoxylate/hydroxypyruvate reductase B n=1 Tax=Acinetobacter wanghuae TaxID=2662362 RepID=A0A5Q0P0Z4_9GAMM|nr:D-glycerate dehydrogenase [Acinetobacter wanghuae]MQW92936.1 bifunctional glyoxylate/hydroxypyruvate reductase B [Acinetobacter wanghuae]QGA10827.1 bifunctional glyoxylate/hydroxypyruvate reductase B [Acinetobacter wanghuae]
MMQKVVVFSQIDADIQQKLEQHYKVVNIHPKLGDVNQQLLEHVKDADALIGAGRRLNEQNLSTATKLKVISSVSVGYDNYDLNYLNQRHIHLAHTPHVLTETTADLAFTLLMSAARQVGYLDRWTKQGQWQRTVSDAQFGMDIFAKTLGIIGLGHIGAAIARRGFHGFNMDILYHNRREKPELAQAFNAEYCELNDLLRRSDFVVIAVDLNEDSKHLIGALELAQMQPHAVLVNIARGSVIDEQALINALKNRQIFAAGLDVYQKEPLTASELFELENVIALPHVGSATAATRKKMAYLAYQNLRDALEGLVSPYLVNPDFK